MPKLSLRRPGSATIARVCLTEETSELYLTLSLSKWRQVGYEKDGKGLGRQEPELRIQ